MGDHHNRPSGHEAVHRPLDHRLGARIEARRRLVEHEHRGIGERGPGERVELTFPGGEAAAPLAHLGVEALGKQAEPLVGSHDRECGVDVGIGGAGPCDADVLTNRSAEQKPFLRHDDDAVAERGQGRVTEIDPAERDRPELGVVHPGDELRGVDFPALVGPTSASRSPGAIVISTSRRTHPSSTGSPRRR